MSTESEQSEDENGVEAEEVVTYDNDKPTISYSSVPLKLTMPPSLLRCEALGLAWVKKYLRISPGNIVFSAQIIKLSGVRIRKYLHFIIRAISEVFGSTVEVVRVGEKRGYKNIKVSLL